VKNYASAPMSQLHITTHTERETTKAIITAEKIIRQHYYLAFSIEFFSKKSEKKIKILISTERYLSGCYE
jgi:hypothetical protein